MKDFLLISKKTADGKLNEAIDSIAGGIEKNGGHAVMEIMPDLSDEKEVKRIKGIVAAGIDGIISIGGDGTLIRSAQFAMEEMVPILGVNFGHLGYLCEYDEKGVMEAIPRLIADEYEIEERMMLSGRMIGDDEKPVTSRLRALNDVVISSSDSQQVLHMAVCVGDKPLYEFTGDGMIFATPTGSTAYNLSANGPIVDPKTRLILMTPLNPHTLSTRGMVLDASDEISLSILPRKHTGDETARVSFDGTTSFTLRHGHKLQVRTSRSTTRIIKLNDLNFLERIRRKMMQVY